jgi:hypothetical protein
VATSLGHGGIIPSLVHRNKEQLHTIMVRGAYSFSQLKTFVIQSVYKAFKRDAVPIQRIGNESLRINREIVIFTMVRLR